MHLPFESPWSICLLNLFFFFFLGFFFQFIISKLVLNKHCIYFFESSVTFITVGSSLQYLFISFFYGSKYAKFFSSLEFMFFSEFSKGGFVNPIDNFASNLNNKYLRIAAQFFGSFISVIFCFFLWNFTYGSLRNTILTTEKEQNRMTVDIYMCKIPLQVSPYDGFLSEFMGSMVRLVMAQWNFSTKKWLNKTLKLIFRLILKEQGKKFFL